MSSNDVKKLKKQLSLLKKIRLQVITGERCDYSEYQMDLKIEKVRELIGSKDDRKVIFEAEKSRDGGLDLTYGYDLFLKDLETMEMSQIITSRALHTMILVKWILKHEGETEMAKITVEQYKNEVAAGKTNKEIAKEYGLSEQSMYAYRAKWKKEGLLEGKKPVEMKSEPVTEDKIAELLVAIEQRDEEYAALNYVYKDLQIDSADEIKKLTEQNDELQNIAHGYEKHAEELEEQNVGLKAELSKVRGELIELKAEVKNLLQAIEIEKKNEKADINREMHLLLLDDYTQRLKA